jgi:hypothetical protein
LRDEKRTKRFWRGENEKRTKRLWRGGEEETPYMTILFTSRSDEDEEKQKGEKKATMNQHPPAHHPLDASHYSVVDEPKLS